MRSFSNAHLYLQEALFPYFEHKRYMLLNRGSGQFSRSTNFGLSTIQMSVTNYTGSVYVEFFLGIRHQLLEETLKNVTGFTNHYNDQSHTLLVSWYHIWPEVLLKRYECRNFAELDAVADILIDFLDSRGFDFLHKYRTTLALCDLLNSESNISREWAHHNYLHAFRGLLLAKLSGSSDLSVSYTNHRAYLLERGFGEKIIDSFDRMYESNNHQILN